MRWYLSFVFVDSRGRHTKRLIECTNLTVDYTTALPVVASLVTDLQQVTDLGLERVDFITKGIGAGFAAVSPSNVDVGGTVQVLLEGDLGKKASIKIPGIKDLLVLADGHLDFTPAGDLDAWLTHWTMDPPRFYVSDGEEVESVIDGTLDK